jgi:hypothetical protein
MLTSTTIKNQSIRYKYAALESLTLKKINGQNAKNANALNILVNLYKTPQLDRYTLKPSVKSSSLKGKQNR